VSALSRYTRVAASLSVPALESLLTEQLSWRNTLRAALPGTYVGLSLDRLPINTLVGLLPSAEYTSEVIVTPALVRGEMATTFVLSHKRDEWQAEPQIVRSTWLADRIAFVIERVDWLVALSDLTAGLRTFRNWQHLDFTPWTIAAAWPDWKRDDLSWEKRAEDLARRLGCNPLSPNTLNVKCRRMGLTRK